MLAGNPTFHIIPVSLYVLKLFAIKTTLGESVATACRKCLEQVGSAEMKHFASVVVGQLENILTTPSGGVKHTDVWIKYHQLRLSESIRRAWEPCVTRLCIEEDIVHHTLQVILKRMVSAIIHHRIEARSSVATTSTVCADRLTTREENILRYMAGYVVVKTRNKFPRHSSTILPGFLETDLDAGLFGGESTLEYSKIWIRQVDRGGLCHVNDKFFQFLMEVEYVCRRHLDVRIPPPRDNLHIRMMQAVVGSSVVMDQWKEIVDPSSTSKAANDILSYIIQLWTVTRIHSFVKKWSEKLTSTKSHAKSTRKTLKNKGTDKESN